MTSSDMNTLNSDLLPGLEVHSLLPRLAVIWHEIKNVCSFVNASSPGSCSLPLSNFTKVVSVLEELTSGFHAENRFSMKLVSSNFKQVLSPFL